MPIWRIRNSPICSPLGPELLGAKVRLWLGKDEATDREATYQRIPKSLNLMHRPDSPPL